MFKEIKVKTEGWRCANKVSKKNINIKTLLIMKIPGEILVLRLIYYTTLRFIFKAILIYVIVLRTSGRG